MRLLRDRPVVQGLLAMVAVTLVIAGAVGLGAWIATSAIGLGDDGASDVGDSGGARPSMYLPKPSESKKRGPGPLISPGVQPRQSPRKSAADNTTEEAEDKEIVLKASPKNASSMQEVTLQGTYPGADGAILSIEKLQSGSWISFVGVTTRVSAGRFSTTIQTGVLGENKFRAVDTDSETTSNEVTVTIG